MSGHQCDDKELLEKVTLVCASVGLTWRSVWISPPLRWTPFTRVLSGPLRTWITHTTRPGVHRRRPEVGGPETHLNIVLFWDYPQSLTRVFSPQWIVEISKERAGSARPSPRRRSVSWSAPSASHTTLTSRWRRPSRLWLDCRSLKSRWVTVRVVNAPLGGTSVYTLFLLRKFSWIQRLFSWVPCEEVEVY